MHILASTVTGCILISRFASLVWHPVGITNSAVGISICAITAGIKKCEEKEEKAWENSAVRKDKLNAIQVLISNFD